MKAGAMLRRFQRMDGAIMACRTPFLLLAAMAVSLGACGGNSGTTQRNTAVFESIETKRKDLYRRDMRGAIAALPSPDFTRAIDPFSAADWIEANVAEACAGMRAPADAPNTPLMDAIEGAPALDPPRIVCALRLSSDGEAVFTRFDPQGGAATLTRRFDLGEEEGTATLLRTPFLSYGVGDGDTESLGSVRTRGATPPDGPGWSMTTEKTLGGGTEVSSRYAAVGAYPLVSLSGARERIHLISVRTESSLTDSGGVAGGWRLFLEGANAVVDSGSFPVDIETNDELSPQMRSLVRVMQNRLKDMVRQIGGAPRKPETVFLAIVLGDGSVRRFGADQFGALNDEVARLRRRVNRERERR